eukprot:1137148-Pelagomonas_calceolata.AAC.3
MTHRAPHTCLTLFHLYTYHFSRVMVMERLKGAALVDYNAIRSITTKVRGASLKGKCVRAWGCVGCAGQAGHG